MADNTEWNAVCSWLKSLKYEQYVGAFEDNGFDLWEIIRELTVADLKAAGIKAGHAIRMHKKIPTVNGSTEHKEDSLKQQKATPEDSLNLAVQAQPAKPFQPAQPVGLMSFHQLQECNVDRSGDGSNILQECQCLKRVIYALQLMQQFNNSKMNEEAQSRFRAFVDTQYHNFQDDFTHLMTAHSRDLEAIHIAAMQVLPPCDLDKCELSNRHSDKQGSSLVAIDLETQLILNSFDQIHFYVVHLFEAGLRETAEEQKADDVQPEDGTFIDKAFEAMVARLKLKRRTFSRFSRRLGSERSKFVICGTRSLHHCPTDHLRCFRGEKREGKGSELLKTPVT